MEIQERDKPSPVSRSVLVIGTLSCLSCVLLVVILGIVGSTHYRLSESEGTASATPLSSSQLAELLPPLDVRFPGHFLTDEEIKVRMAYLSAHIPVTQMINSSDTCSSNVVAPISNFTEQAPPIPFYPIRPADRLYSCCCFSQTGYISPNWLVDIDGVNRTLATFQNKRQLFFQETCQQITSCIICTCKIIPFLTTGVYVSGSSYGIAMFSVSGSCKCQNIGTTS